jgi:long-subunit fatty acid transport protein
MAVISLDYEYKDYGGMKFSRQYLNDYNFVGENQYIKEDFNGSSTIRLGGEVRFTPQFSARLGTAWMQQPYDSDVKNGYREVMTPGTISNYRLDGNTFYVTGGVGYRFTPQFYIDLALVYRTQKDDLYFFSPIVASDGSSILDSTPAKLTDNSLKTLVTLGYKF